MALAVPRLYRIVAGEPYELIVTLEMEEVDEAGAPTGNIVTLDPWPVTIRGFVGGVELHKQVDAPTIAFTLDGDETALLAYGSHDGGLELDGRTWGTWEHYVSPDKTAASA